MADGLIVRRTPGALLWRRASGSSAFFVLQGGASATAFLCWALNSHVIPVAGQVPAATALGWGLVAYLPLTIGLPYLLPNLFRRTDPESVGLRASVSGLLCAVSVVAALAGLLIALVGLAGGDGFAPFALAAGLAGALVVSITCQQRARIHRDPGLMVLSVVANLVMPVGWLAGWALTGRVGLAAVVDACLLLAYVAVIAVAIRRRDRAGATGVRGVGDAIRRSAPMVPHLLAFAALMQGIRFSTAIFAPSSALLLGAHFLMTFVSMGFTVIVGVQGIVSVDVQLAREGELRSRWLRSAAALGAAGVVTAGVVVGVYASPLRLLFRGAPEPTPALLAVLLLPIPLTCAFFIVSNLFVREERTASLAVVTCTVAAGYLLAALLLRPHDYVVALALWCVALAALPLVLAVVEVRHRAALRLPARARFEAVA